MDMRPLPFAIYSMSWVLMSTLASCAAPVAALAQEQLPRLNIDPAGISISGLSSGADFAVQFQVAFSKTIMGLGVFAGQPFHCAVTRFSKDQLVPRNPDVPFCEGCPANSTLLGDHCKSHPDVVEVQKLAAAAERLAAEGLIDDLMHLRKARVYTYCGTEDQSHFGATQKAQEFFAQFLPASNLLYNFTVPSGHCWPQDDGLSPCSFGGKYNPWPWENCGYDGPGALLQHVYGQLKPPADSIKHASLHSFDQAPFTGNAELTGLGSTGLVYIPDRCIRGQKCTLHVSFHGCSNPMVLEYLEARSLSFNRWAESNDMVILWPHSESHGGANATVTERHGCWDGYGQTGSNYDTQQGVQMQAIRKMIEAIAGVDMMRSDSISSSRGSPITIV
eukprot:TRINITY_DN15321_c0_g1_i1.p1 TRINITY_DN15321_c0_g1~~TRINITY_DN15321_c0_g1_i1.p1  ORF type:complete len:390 (-),score=43.81 TRINITY_DN15321_c0_g1_i1:130-1299(-)